MKFAKILSILAIFLTNSIFASEPFSIVYFSQQPSTLEKLKNPQSIVIAMPDEAILKNKALLDQVDILCLKQEILENVELSSMIFENYADKIFNGNIVPTFADYQTTVKVVELNAETVLYLVNMTYIENIDHLLRRYYLYRLNDFSFLFQVLKPNKKNIIVAISDSPLPELKFLLSSSSSLFDIIINIREGKQEIITKNGKTAFHGLLNGQIGILTLTKDGKWDSY